MQKNSKKSTPKKSTIISKIPIEVYTRWLIPFDNFLLNESTEKLQVVIPLDASRVADFAFRGVYIDFKWSQKSEISLTLKHLLYLYYYHIFWIQTYSIIENFGLDNEKCYLIDEYERVGMNYLLPEVMISKRINRWPVYWILPNNARIFPIKVWQQNENDFEDLKQILKKFAPNQEFDKNIPEKEAELSLQTWEIYEYFLSNSKNLTTDSISDIRAKLLDKWIDSNVSDEKLQKQMNIVSKFLSNILI